MTLASLTYGPSNLTIEQINTSTGAVLYLHHDQAGSSRLLTGSTGKAEATFTYGPYGALTGCTGTATTPLGYDGQYTNSDTSLIYLRARNYDPVTGQFLTVDPLRAITKTPYNYAADSPVNHVDPFGLETFPVDIPVEAPIIDACATPMTAAECVAVGPIIYYDVVEAKRFMSEFAGEEAGDEGEQLLQEREATEGDCPQEPKSLPYRGEPNSSDVLDRGNGSGQIRDYGPDGLPTRDFDFGHDHGFGDPHAHDWDEGVRSPGRPIGPNE